MPTPHSRDYEPRAVLGKDRALNDPVHSEEAAEDVGPERPRPCPSISGFADTSADVPPEADPRAAVPEEGERYEVWVCPDCGDQITDPPEYDPKRHVYARGHYPAPPEDWPEGEDPWFDAVRIEAAPVAAPAPREDEEALVERMAQAMQEATHRPGESAFKAMARAALSSARERGDDD